MEEGMNHCVIRNRMKRCRPRMDLPARELHQNTLLLLWTIMSKAKLPGRDDSLRRDQKKVIYSMVEQRLEYTIVVVASHTRRVTNPRFNTSSVSKR